MDHRLAPNPITRHMEPFFRWLGILCGYCIMLLALGISLEIVARKLLSVSIPGTDDFGGYILAITTTIGAAYTLLIRAHTRIDIFFSRFSFRMQAILNVVAYGLFATFTLFMAWRSYVVLNDTLLFQSRSTSSLQTPLWMPQGLWFFGLCLLALLATLFAVHALGLLISNRLPEVNSMYGPAMEEKAVQQPAKYTSDTSSPDSK